jgi:TrkA domain protein
VDVKEVLLPSIGVRYEFTSHDGERIGIMTRFTGGARPATMRAV